MVRVVRLLVLRVLRVLLLLVLRIGGAPLSTSPGPVRAVRLLIRLAL